jgi:hypothetical protein
MRRNAACLVWLQEKQQQRQHYIGGINMLLTCYVIVTFQSSQAKGMDVTMTVHDDRGLLALQGPSAFCTNMLLTCHFLCYFLNPAGQGHGCNNDGA